MTMTSLKTIAAAALLSTLAVSPVSAEPYSASQAYAAMEGSVAVHHARHHRAAHANR